MGAGMAAEPAEPCAAEGASAQPMHGELLARVLERDNLRRALKQVRRNKGAPGIDGMSVDELPEHLKHHWLEIRASIEAGRYRPQPVRRVEIPKADGSKRKLGIPPCWTDFSSRPLRRLCRRNGSHTFILTATASDRGARPIRPCASCKPRCAKGATGWSTWTSNHFSTGSTTTDC